MSDGEEASENVLQVVGMTGSKHVYFNISPEEALRRYNDEVDSNLVLGLKSVETVEFDDKFRATNIWTKDS